MKLDPFPFLVYKTENVMYL